MLLSTLSLIAFFLPAALGAASPKKLTDGKSMEYGALSGGLKQYQASGIITQGCSMQTTISSCYELFLSSNPKSNLDDKFADSPRQRIEFRTVSHGAGAQYTFTWKQHLASSVGTSSKFFHLMQIFDESANKPIMTLSALNEQLTITDFARKSCGGKCPSVPINNYRGKTTLHTAKVKFGPSGSIDYTIKDSSSGKTILTYSAKGTMGGQMSYLKYGTYRAAFAGMTPSEAAVGDFTYK